MARFLAAASGANTCGIAAMRPLAGGAIQENWGIDADFRGGDLAGEQQLVLRAAGATGVPSSLDRMQEFAVLKAAFAAGVTVPEPLYACSDAAIFGKPFFVMRHASGNAAGHRITRDAALDPALPKVAERLGRELARIHSIRPPRPDLDFLPPAAQTGPLQQVAALRAYLDTHPAPRPVLEWGLRWLETHLPAAVEPVLCHHDFRTGNYLLDGPRLTGILDWEFAGWGDGHEDIGWFCSKSWRFARLDREAGGIADRAPFYRGYEALSGRMIDPKQVHFWEVMASLRWAVIALQQADRHISGGERSLDLALTGRRADECELEILILLDPAGPPDGRIRDPRKAPSPEKTSQRAIDDLPDGPTLLRLAADVLVNDLLPLLPPERRLTARMVASSMAIAEREANSGEETAEVEAAIAAVRALCGPRAGDRELLTRLACALRNGAFENSAERLAQARAILWRLTIARLRLANPRFLAANGFS